MKKRVITVWWKESPQMTRKTVFEGDENVNFIEWRMEPSGKGICVKEYNVTESKGEAKFDATKEHVFFEPVRISVENFS